MTAQSDPDNQSVEEDFAEFPARAAMERSVACLAVELPGEVWTDVRDRWHAARDEAEAAWETLVQNEAVHVAEIDRLRTILTEVATSDSSALAMLKARRLSAPETAPGSPRESRLQDAYREIQRLRGALGVSVGTAPGGSACQEFAREAIAESRRLFPEVG